MPDYRQFRRGSLRLVGYDYRSEGLYFVTICTKDRVCSLAEIVNGEGILSDMGMVVHDYWREIANLYPHVSLGEFVVMPNHLHGILHFTAKDDVAALHRNAVDHPAGAPNAVDHHADTHHADNPLTNTHMANLSPKPGSLSRIIGQYKAACTRMINSLCTETFAWQPRFHDRIIRSEAELRNVEEYILNNPAKWSEDALFR